MAAAAAVFGLASAPTASHGATIHATVAGPAITPAAAAGTAADLLSLADLLPNPTIIHPDIARQVEVDLGGLGSLPGDLSAARVASVEAVADGHRGRALQSRLMVVQRETRAEHVIAVVEVDDAAAALDQANTDLAAFATGTFIGSTALAIESFSTDTSPSPIPTLAADAEDVLVGAQRAATERLLEAEGERIRIVGELETTARELSEAATAIELADRQHADAEVEIARLEPAFESALRTAPVVGVDFPVVVLDAYYRAALRTAEDRPSCQVRWDQLAGIGKVESGHGTFGGDTVGADGRTDGEILGPVLDGTRFASIPDTDGGRYDLDAVWDRAVGPMQFIPGSWVRFGGDGNGDGAVDPHNLYDAALAAANHLCGSAGGLSDEANYQRALLGYNRSVPYGTMVMDFARRYRAAVGLEPTSDSVSDPVVDVSVAAVRIPLVD